MAQNGASAPERARARTTRSSSAAATTRSSRRRTSRRAASGRSSSSGASASAARPRRPSWAGPGCRGWPTRSAGCGRRSSAISTSRPTACGWSRPTSASSRPQPDGRAVTLWADQARTVDALRGWSGHDADAYPDFDRLVRSLGKFLGEIAAQTPPDIHAPGLGDALTGLKLGRTFRGLGKHDAHTILRVLPMAVADFVAEAFETDAVQAALAWRGVQYCSLGPWSAGTAAVLLFDSAGNDGGAAGQTVFAEGGPGALSEALAAAARAAGAEIRCGADVAAITSTDGRVTGVALASGEEIAARRSSPGSTRSGR